MILIHLRFLLPLFLTVLLNPVIESLASQPKNKPVSSPLLSGIEQVTKDLNNSKVFNPKTCPTYINNTTDYLFLQPADHFLPKAPEEIEYFKAHGTELIKKIFLIRVKLRELLQEYDKNNELSNECVLKMREGTQYARFTEEYLLEWLVHEKVVAFKDAPILGGDEPFVLRNPKFSELKLQAGDVMLIRGVSFVSAMIARIGDEEGNFSHMAIVAEDGQGGLHVVESLIQYGVIVTPLEKWRQAHDSRVALFRHPDMELSHRAARIAYDWSLTHPDYDFAMDDSNYDKVFCAEVIRYAYDKASNGALIVPKFRSHVSKFKGGPYPKSLGVTKDTLFTPYDIEVDPRFDFVAEGKYYPALRQVRMQDSILQSIYSWMIEKNYTFYGSASVTAQSYAGKAIRYLGFMKEDFPTYMPIETMQSVIQFQTIAELLEANLYAKEDAYYKAHGYLPSFQEMMVANDAYRREDCLHYQKKESSKFHSIFRGSSCN
ncbi:YiiX/YebB-like N1pC/P60 family cysteine hydrolase [Bdellovibrio svalbardensis]|uniref:YiiX/YebB-like N1pC/P60 family cysteine hydrolase n=1 Tax=Bdellovibrio svalbardensis TaxID=2972972 RepID=A0ABT6DM28_9BACT|nr:YiiX/YebB-like N1pC/P60 family cysteine hydrolase [Bdellovibrio svalbardensis]MDG0816871.1 YiiX/YebB-like N1pC/P60 family cysteine hydrolase [Bdellovibrio svalbardensis]